MDNTTQTKDKARQDALVAKYGWITGMRYFWFGEPTARLTEREPKLPWYSQAIFYVSSGAALLIFASSDIVALQHADLFRTVVISAMIGMLLLLVFAVDKSFNRTVPRIGLLLQRHEIGMAIEHIIFVFAVALLEMGMLFILLLHENDINSILTGTPLIPRDSIWFYLLAASRVILAIWTVIHSYFVNEPLPVTWTTLQRNATELVGGKSLEKIQGLNLEAVGLAPLVQTLILLFQPAKTAPRTFRFGYDRVQAQALLDKDHRETIVGALEQIDAQSRGVSVPAVIVAPAAPEPVKPPQPEPAKETPNVIPFDATASANETDNTWFMVGLPDGVSMEKEYTQAEMAEVLGVSVGALSQAMRDATLPPYNIVFKRGSAPGRALYVSVGQVLEMKARGILTADLRNVSVGTGAGETDLAQTEQTDAVA